MNMRVLIIGLVLLVSAIGVIAVINNSENVVDVQAVDAKVSTDASGHTVTDISKNTGHVVNKLDMCIDEKYNESTPQYGNCTYNADVCDALNTSCHKEARTYTCYTGSVSVEKTSKKCKTDGYKIGKNKLNTGDYVCNVSDDVDSTTVVCDSKYDGNGDGICTSGESCMKFVVNGNNIDVYKRNSKDEYVKDDPTYFLAEASTEVEE